jgi:hypothetical protein
MNRAEGKAGYVSQEIPGRHAKGSPVRDGFFTEAVGSLGRLKIKDQSHKEDASNQQKSIHEATSTV